MAEGIVNFQSASSINCIHDLKMHEDLNRRPISVGPTTGAKVCSAVSEQFKIEFLAF